MKTEVSVISSCMCTRCEMMTPADHDRGSRGLKRSDEEIESVNNNKIEVRDQKVDEQNENFEQQEGGSNDKINDYSRYKEMLE